MSLIFFEPKIDVNSQLNRPHPSQRMKSFTYKTTFFRFFFLEKQIFGNWFLNHEMTISVSSLKFETHNFHKCATQYRSFDHPKKRSIAHIKFEKFSMQQLPFANSSQTVSSLSSLGWCDFRDDYNNFAIYFSFFFWRFRHEKRKKQSDLLVKWFIKVKSFSHFPIDRLHCVQCVKLWAEK